MRPHILLCLATLYMAGCTSSQQKLLPPAAIMQEQLLQDKLALTQQNQLNSRLLNVSWRLLTASDTYCNTELKPSLGLVLHELTDYPEEQQGAAKTLYGELDIPTVKHSIDGSPSDGKLMEGDQLLAINNTAFPKTSANAIKALKKTMETDRTVTLLISRKDEEITVTLSPTKLCYFPITFIRQDSINAFADGHSITVTTGLMRFAEQDSELALIIAHEIAHNLNRHSAEKLRNGIMGGILDIVLSAAGGFVSPGILAGLAVNLPNQSYEVEADQAAVYLMHEAGYPLNNLPEFWRKMAAEHPSSIRHTHQASHPTTVERYLLLKQTIKQLHSSQD